VERTLSVQTTDWLMYRTDGGRIDWCVVPRDGSHLGRFVRKHREVPFGTLFSLAELIVGLALAWYWLGLYAAIATYPAGSLVAFVLTLAMGGHVQVVWLLAQVTLLLSGAWWLFQIVSGRVTQELVRYSTSPRSAIGTQT
jgi:hypothetical protein